MKFPLGLGMCEELGRSGQKCQTLLRSQDCLHSGSSSPSPSWDLGTGGGRITSIQFLAQAETRRVLSLTAPRSLLPHIIIAQFSHQSKNWISKHIRKAIFRYKITFYDDDGGL